MLLPAAELLQQHQSALFVRVSRGNMIRECRRGRLSLGADRAVDRRLHDHLLRLFFFRQCHLIRRPMPASMTGQIGRTREHFGALNATIFGVHDARAAVPGQREGVDVADLESKFIVAVFLVRPCTVDRCSRRYR